MFLSGKNAILNYDQQPLHMSNIMLFTHHKMESENLYTQFIHNHLI